MTRVGGRPMGLTRREFVMAAVASASAPARAGDAAVSIVLAPSNLGLSPVGSQQQGTWRAPQALMQAGLAKALDADEVISLERPAYQFDAQPGTRIRNGVSIRAFSLQYVREGRGHPASWTLPRRHRRRLQRSARRLVRLAICRRPRTRARRRAQRLLSSGELRHARRFGAVAGMDLALASGRGEELADGVAARSASRWPSTPTSFRSVSVTVVFPERASRNGQYNARSPMASTSLHAQCSRDCNRDRSTRYGCTSISTCSMMRSCRRWTRRAARDSTTHN